MSGDLLAGRITTTVQSDGAKEVSLYYYHLDHLNSTKIVSDEEGAVDVRYVYRAFGEQLAKIGEGDARYTYSGKELDSETNLYYFNARYYDAVIGRFISEDPIRDGLNWYVYADNNPLKLVDPTGFSSKIITYKKEQVYSKADAITCDIVNFILNPPILHWAFDLGIDISESIFSISIKLEKFPDIKAGDERKTTITVEFHENRDITVTSQTTYYLYSKGLV